MVSSAAQTDVWPLAASTGRAWVRQPSTAAGSTLPGCALEEAPVLRLLATGGCTPGAAAGAIELNRLGRVRIR